MAVVTGGKKRLVSRYWCNCFSNLWGFANLATCAYAAYGGVFIVLSILWGWGVDRVAPDKYDWFGGWIALLGVLVIMYAPRR